MQNQSRENRIYNEIIVDCHDEYEQQSGWYCYMEDQLHFPFKATITLKKRSGAKKEQPVD